jgi:hypothetical protein
MRLIRKHFSYANVMSTFGVFIALGLGSAYAADKIGSKDIAKNAVKSKHVKGKAVKTKHIAKGAVNSKKVADRSLLSVDFAPNQLPQGAKGDPGPQGQQGERGPSDAYFAFNNGGAAPASAVIEVTREVPAGEYTATAVARGENDTSTTHSIYGSCTLFENTNDGISNQSYSSSAYLPPKVNDINPRGSAMLPATTVFRFAEPGTITYRCQASTIGGAATGANWRNLAITATRVATLNG